MDINKVTLKKNDTVLTKDIHAGYAGNSSVANKYYLNLNDYETGAVFEVLCAVFADHNKNSNGFVYLKKL